MNEILLAKAKKAKTETDRKIQKDLVEQFISDLADILGRGIEIKGIDSVDSVISKIEKFGQDTADLVSDIRQTISSIDELDIPENIEFKHVSDPVLIKTLRDIGNQDELIAKLAALDQTIIVLKDTLTAKKRNPEDYQPVRIVLGQDSNLKFLENWPVPIFSGGVSSSTGGLTDAELRASPVEVTGDLTVSATPLSRYTYIQKDTSGGTYKYYGYADANTAGAWAIKRITIASNLAEYVSGSSSYTTAWTNRASQTYQDIWAVF